MKMQKDLSNEIENIFFFQIWIVLIKTFHLVPILPYLWSSMFMFEMAQNAQNGQKWHMGKPHI